MNLPNFWYGTSLNFDSFRGTNHTVSCFLKKFTEVQKLGPPFCLLKMVNSTLLRPPRMNKHCPCNRSKYEKD